MLIRLAAEIQNTGGGGVISITECRAIFCNFLTDDINGPGYSLYEAQHQSKSIIDYAQTGLGLLVERATNELGFFHLTVQEYLAARAIVRKDENEQIAWLASVWDQPRWHEVVLSWFCIIGTEQGKGVTQRAIDHLKQNATSPFTYLQLLILRTELAVGDLGLSPREARLTIDEAANHVETSPYPELSRELARYLTLGLRSSTVATQCLNRLVNWGPSRSEWTRASLLTEFGSWQKSEDLLNALKLALHGESVRCRFAAAESLAKAFESETIVKDHLAELGARWPDAGVRAAALHGLGQGWPQYEALNILADDACCSADSDLMLIGIALRVAAERQDGKDRNKMWSMLSRGRVSYELRSYCRNVLVRGWSKDKELKELAMEALSNRFQNGSRFEEEQILSFLAESWPGDQEVGSCLANWFIGLAPTFLIHDNEIWNNLIRGFKHNADLASALRLTLEQQRSQYNSALWGPDTKSAYCIIGDDAAKADLLQEYASASRDLDKVWIVSTLMEAWPNDSDVKELLSCEILKPPGEIGFLSRWAGILIPDPESRRKWLLAAMKESGIRSGRYAIIRLLEEFQDEECLEAALYYQEQDIWYYDKIEIQNQLIASFPQVPEIRGWAECSFVEIDSNSLASVAIGYKQDSCFRDRLLRAACPANVHVRAEIFCALREHSIPKDIVLQLTEEIWAEANDEIRSAGAIARCDLALQYPELKEALIEKLNKEINSLGTNFEMRRRTAFACLLQLGEYTACLDAMAQKSPSALHWIARYHGPDEVAIRTLFANYDKLSEISAAKSQSLEIPWGAIIYNGSAREAFSNKTARSQLIDYLKTMRPQDWSRRSLELMAELLPKSKELSDCLVESIKGHGFSNLSFEAQRIFAEQFRGDDNAYTELEKCWSVPQEYQSLPEVHPPFLYALALGWPESALLHPYLSLLEIPKGFPIITALALCGLTGNKNHALACIDRLIQITLEDGQKYSDTLRVSLSDWAHTSQAEPVLHSLFTDENMSRRITACSLLASIGKLTSVYRNSLIQQFDEAVGNTSKYCPDGINLLYGTTTTLPQTLFSLLMPGLNNDYA